MTDEFNALFDETTYKATNLNEQPSLMREQADKRIRSFIGSKINKRKTLRGVRDFLTGHKRNRAASVIQRAVRRRGTKEDEAFGRFLNAPDSHMDFQRRPRHFEHGRVRSVESMRRWCW